MGASGVREHIVDLGGTRGTFSLTCCLVPSAGPVSPTSVTQSLHQALQDGIHHCIDMLLRCDGMGRILNRGVGLNTDCGTLQCIDCGTLTAEQDGQNIEQGGRTQD